MGMNRTSSSRGARTSSTGAIRTYGRAESMIGAGMFNRPIIIEKPTETLTATRGKTTIWSTHVSTKAYKRLKSGKSEASTAQQTYPIREAWYYIRFRPSDNIDTTMRIVDQGHIYGIRSVNLVEGYQESLEIVTEELQAKGSLKT